MSEAAEAPENNTITGQMDAIAVHTLPTRRRCYLCHIDLNRTHKQFQQVAENLDAARGVFEEFHSDDEQTITEHMKKFHEVYQRARIRNAETNRANLVPGGRKRPIIFEDVALEDFFKHFKNHHQTRTQRTILKNDRMDNLHDKLMTEVDNPAASFTETEDSKDYVRRTQAYLNKMRALMMVNQVMNLPRYQAINQPRISINKQHK